VPVITPPSSERNLNLDLLARRDRDRRPRSPRPLGAVGRRQVRRLRDRDVVAPRVEIDKPEPPGFIRDDAKVVANAVPGQRDHGAWNWLRRGVRRDDDARDRSATRALIGRTGRSWSAAITTMPMTAAVRIVTGCPEA
jgi:hypothetical protein